jgi:hypothetical protein
MANSNTVIDALKCRVVACNDLVSEVGARADPTSEIPHTP